MTRLPEDFIKKLSGLLGEEEFQAFMDSFKDPRYYGLRINTLRTSIATCENLGLHEAYQLTPILWTLDGFYYNDQVRPGINPYYHAGLYYIQEPSAMLPAVVLEPKPGERVLDLCAAPGGKTVQIAAAMKNQGLIVSNDINPKRVKALIKNIELCGIKNAVVTNMSPEELKKHFTGFFDRILIDAPCSGEGMFRKDPDAVKAWEAFKCEKCAGMQTEILETAEGMLKPGGVLVYSTCTFSPEEDEMIIGNFLRKFKDFRVDEIKVDYGISAGRPEWADGNPDIKGTVRLWPHKLKGEGHFVAKLAKGGSEGTESNDTDLTVTSLKPEKTSIELFNAFVQDNLNTVIEGVFAEKNGKLYLLPQMYPGNLDIRALKYGWYLGDVVNKRFEPSQSLVLGLEKNDIQRVIDLEGHSVELNKYLKGETLNIEGDKGLFAICVDGHTVGWAKQNGGFLKNMYPKGWRKMT